MDDIYTRLHSAIVKGQLLPNERLVELDLAQRFGAGRADIRTALAQLGQDGLVEREPNRGARVRVISQAEAVEIYEARAVLEGVAARYAARNATPTEIVALYAIHANMKQHFASGDLLSISDLNAQLHHQIGQIAAHQTVAQLIGRLRAQNVRFQYRTILLKGRAEQSLAEHLAIIDTIAAHDEAAAEAAMRTHVMHVVEALRYSA